jgi:hypothetical protein
MPPRHRMAKARHRCTTSNQSFRPPPRLSSDLGPTVPQTRDFRRRFLRCACTFTGVRVTFGRKRVRVLERLARLARRVFQLFGVLRVY